MKHSFLTTLTVCLSGQLTFATADDLAEANDSKITEHVLVTGSKQTGQLLLDDSAKTGSLLDLSLRDLPASVSVLDQDMIQQLGARTALEAVESAVGMTGGTGVGSIPAYSTRGFSSNDITIMRDGVRQNTNSQSARPLDSFMFERVEVLKGPASLLHGEGAVGGAVNYVTKMPSDTFKGETLLTAGSWDSYRAAVGVGGPTGIESLSYRLDISHYDTGGYVEGSEETYDAYGGSIRWEPNENVRFLVSGSFYEDDVKSYYGTPVVYDAVSGIGGQVEVRPADTSTDKLIGARIASGTRRNNYNVLDNYARAENGFGRWVSDIRLSDNWELRNELYVATQKLDWRNTERNVWNPVTEQVDRGSFYLIYRDDTQVGNRLDLNWQGELLGRPNQLVVGTLFDRNNQNRNSGQDYSNTPIPESVSLQDPERGYGPDEHAQRTAKIITQTTAFYFENNLTVTDELSVILGLRYDAIDVERKSYVGIEKYTKTYYPLTGRFGAVYRVSPSWNVYGSYSKAAQPVSQLVSLNASRDEFSLQKGEQVEVGAKASLFDEVLGVTFALYDIEKNDILTFDIIDGERVSSQIGSQVSQGAELATTLQLPDYWSLAVNFAWNWKAEYEDFNENLGDGTISRSGNTPANVPEIVSSININKLFGNWQIGAGVRYVDEREANTNNGIQLDAYTTLDASIKYQWQNYTFTLRGRNLTDETYSSWASMGGLALRLDDPRSVEFGAHYAFGE